MVAIKPSTPQKQPEEVDVGMQSRCRTWFYITFAIVAYFLITAAMFHRVALNKISKEMSIVEPSHKLMSHRYEHYHGNSFSHHHKHSHSHSNNPLDYHSSRETKSNDWDSLIFTQHWPSTVCHQWEEKTHNGCNFPRDKEMWSIHGVWPTKKGSMGPFFCNKVRFNVSALDPIADELDEYWLDVEKGRKKNDLWIHEWTKHGTCALSDPPLDSELKYFSQALAWFKEYNMENILAAKDIHPQQEELSQVNTMDVWNAVKEVTQANPNIRCVHDKQTGNTYLFEIRLCFDKNLKIIDCDGTKVHHRRRGFQNEGIITNCPIDKPITYPSVKPQLNSLKSEPQITENSASTASKIIGYFQSLFVDKDVDNGDILTT